MCSDILEMRAVDATFCVSKVTRKLAAGVANHKLCTFQPGVFGSLLEQHVFHSSLAQNHCSLNGNHVFGALRYGQILPFEFS